LAEDCRRAIYKDYQDRERFLENIGRNLRQDGAGRFTQCLVWNHFHLVVETPQGNLVAGMNWFFGTLSFAVFVAISRAKLCGVA
jgi:putative transposase